VPYAQIQAPAAYSPGKPNVRFQALPRNGRNGQHQAQSGRDKVKNAGGLID
jgi:hypothetical protein